MNHYPFEPVAVNWKRPPVDRAIMRQCTQRSDIKGLLHCLGSLAILGASGALAYLMFSAGRWGWMAVALYIHGGLHAFQPQTHELSHGTLFRTRWINSLFRRIFGLVFWTGNSALYRMSHEYHHRYTLHRKSDGEVILPMPEVPEAVLHSAIRVVDVTAVLITLYDQIYFLFKPFENNPRRGTWLRYAYVNSTRERQRDLYWTHVSQLLFHALFSAASIASGHWFLIVVVTLPGFYGGKWYSTWVHDTMHVGRQPETDDFRLCCRSVRLDPVTSFLYWHMEFHTEHHTFPGIPCYNLKRFYNLTREHWEPPMSLVAAWREMHRKSREHLCLPVEDAPPAA
jgi:fatty acid desaturase